MANTWRADGRLELSLMPIMVFLSPFLACPASPLLKLLQISRTIRSEVSKIQRAHCHSSGSTRNMSFKLLRRSSEKQEKRSQVTFLLTLSQLAGLRKEDGQEPKAQGGGNESCGRVLVAAAEVGQSYLWYDALRLDQKASRYKSHTGLAWQGEEEGHRDYMGQACVQFWGTGHRTRTPESHLRCRFRTKISMCG